MKRLIWVILFTFYTIVLSAKVYDLVNPSGKLKLQIEVLDNISWTLLVNNDEVLSDNRVSMSLADGRILGNSPKVKEVSYKTMSEKITSPFYRQALIVSTYNAMILRFQGNYSLEFRAYDDGVAYRFKTEMKEGFQVKDECVEFKFANDYDMIIPYSDNRVDKYTSSFESQYTLQKVSESTEAECFGFFPIALNLKENGWLLLMESDLISYPGAFVRSMEGAIGLKVIFPPMRETEKETSSGCLYPQSYKNVIAEVEGTRSFPWRVIGYAAVDKELPLNNMVYKLASPSRVEDVSWILPGKSTWDWWNGARLFGVDFISGNNTDTYKYHIDFASKFGIEYVMIDEGWYSFCDKNMLNPRADLNLSELCAYAQERGVRIILWAVGHTLEKDAEEICAHYAAMGIAGFKVDFFEAQDQNVVETLYYLAEVTAKHKLLLNIHGTFKPTGLSRTYPNVMNYEGVYGLEQMKWTDKDKANMPLNDVLIPYIRMAAGPLDYTQGAMLNASKNDYRSIDHMAMSQGTRAHQLALYVIFDSPLSMLCDSPSIYLREEECTRFITSIPTCFEKSFVVDGKVGETVIIARKNGENWYVGGITSWNPIDYSLDLSFLEEGEWTAEIIKDGVNSNRIGFDYKKQVLTVDTNSKLDFHMAPGGGFAIILTPKN